MSGSTRYPGNCRKAQYVLSVINWRVSGMWGSGRRAASVPPGSEPSGQVPVLLPHQQKASAASRVRLHDSRLQNQAVQLFPTRWSLLLCWPMFCTLWSQGKHFIFTLMGVLSYVIFGYRKNVLCRDFRRKVSMFPICFLFNTIKFPFFLIAALVMVKQVFDNIVVGFACNE